MSARNGTGTVTGDGAKVDQWLNLPGIDRPVRVDAVTHESDDSAALGYRTVLDLDLGDGDRFPIVVNPDDELRLAIPGEARAMQRLDRWLEANHERRRDG